jgi:F420-non-reducing hydrogenase iron-sulfur subunit
MSAEPTIIAFCCHYCAFTAADLAGTMRLQYPANVLIVRIPCTGKADVNLILHAFVDGADGVLVAGCEVGSCHFIQGNIRAAKRVPYAKKLLAEAGVDPERLEMRHIAASQGPLFAQVATEFTEKIRSLCGTGILPVMKSPPQEDRPEITGTMPVPQCCKTE